MARIAISCLAVILILSSPAAASQVRHTGGVNVVFGDGSVRSVSETMIGGQQPTACDCSNCSAEHCQPPSDSDVDGRDFLVWQR